MSLWAVSFDLDGTLIRNTDSVRYLCALNDRLSELEKIEEAESSRLVSWIEADRLKSRLIKGLATKLVEAKFWDHVELISNVDAVMTHLRKRGAKSALITSGPIQVANVVGTKFGFDSVYGSVYEVSGGEFTGRINVHLGETGKLDCLQDFCAKNGVRLDHCIAVGDSESDVKTFESCGRSIAINYTEALNGKADKYFNTDNLADIIASLDAWLTQ